MAVKTTNIKFFVSKPIALPVENKKTERKTKYIFASKLPEDCFILFYNKPNQTSNKAFSSNKTERDHPKNSSTSAKNNRFTPQEFPTRELELKELYFREHYNKHMKHMNEKSDTNVADVSHKNNYSKVDSKEKLHELNSTR